jgi:hypothetical protein
MRIKSAQSKETHLTLAVFSSPACKQLHWQTTSAGAVTGNALRVFAPAFFWRGRYNLNVEGD